MTPLALGRAVFMQFHLLPFRFAGLWRASWHVNTFVRATLWHHKQKRWAKFQQTLWNYAGKMAYCKDNVWNLNKIVSLKSTMRYIVCILLQLFTLKMVIVLTSRHLSFFIKCFIDFYNYTEFQNCFRFVYFEGITWSCWLDNNNVLTWNLTLTWNY